MNSDIIPNESIFYNIKNYQKRNKLKIRRNKLFRKLENDIEIKFKSFNKKEYKKSNMRNLKNTFIKKFNSSEFLKNSLDNNNNQLSQKKINTKSILPLLNYDVKQKKVLLPKNNIKMNKDKNTNGKYLYLEYKIENNENMKNNDAIYIEIDPYHVIASLTEFPKIREVFKILTKKINQRSNNSKSKNNSISRINIDEILYYLDNCRNNNIINNIINENNSFNNKNDFNITQINSFPYKQNNKNNYSVEELFLLDIINKVIKKATLLHDKRNLNINEAFMLKEYKNQIKNLNIFFDEKINEKNIGGLMISRNGKFTQSQKDINFRSKFIYKENIKRKKYRNGMNIKIFYNLDKTKNKLINNSLSTNNMEKETEKSLNKNKEINILFKKPKLNIYDFDIGPKINIIDLDELLRKISRQRTDRNVKPNLKENISESLMELNKKKISFGNHIIAEKTNLINNKSNIFDKKNINLYSRNFYNRKFNRKKLFIRNDPSINDIHQNLLIKENSMNDAKKEPNMDKNPDDSFSSTNNNDYVKIISKDKLNMQSLKNFEVTKEFFNKTRNKIKEINNNKIKPISQNKQTNNFSFLNTIYGKINSKRKMKINEIDYKEKIKQKGYQLLCDIFLRNPKMELNENINVDDILKFNQEKEYKININTMDRGTSTRDN